MRYILTWWAGFIWSAILAYLNTQNISNIVVVDHLGSNEKRKNLVWKKYIEYLDRADFLKMVSNEWYIQKEDVIIHIGACSSTTEMDSNYLMQNNTKYSKTLFDFCQKVWARLIYASSAATYGNWDDWYSDFNFDLKPLNMYWYSKHLFDQRVISNTNNFSETKGQVVGMKFFNVYWPNEYHKWTMSSMIYHWFNQINKDKKIWLFKSYKPEFADWEQSRDFIYVKDIAKIIYFFIQNPQVSWIYNLWTGISRSFNDLAKSTFQALWLDPNIYYKDMPETMKDKYQYFTQADMKKLRDIWYKADFYSLESWVDDYVKNYLAKWYAVL